MKTKKGISLIVLVLTVIVLAILASAVIITLNNTNVIGETKKATFKSDMAGFKEAYELYLTGKLLENHSYDKSTLDVTYGTATFKEIFGENVPEKYNGLQISSGELKYKGASAEEQVILSELNIGIAYEPSPESWFTNCTIQLVESDRYGQPCFDTSTGTIYSVNMPEGETTLVIPKTINGVEVKKVSGEPGYDAEMYTYMPTQIQKVVLFEGLTLVSGAFYKNGYDGYIDHKIQVVTDGPIKLEGNGVRVYTDDVIEVTEGSDFSFGAPLCPIVLKGNAFFGYGTNAPSLECWKQGDTYVVPDLVVFDGSFYDFNGLWYGDKFSITSEQLQELQDSYNITLNKVNDTTYTYSGDFGTEGAIIYVR